jgi:hypothetical protein
MNSSGCACVGPFSSPVVGPRQATTCDMRAAAHSPHNLATYSNAWPQLVYLMPASDMPSLDAPKTLILLRVSCRFLLLPHVHSLPLPVAALVWSEYVCPVKYTTVVVPLVLQIDLSSDQVVGNLFRSGQWEEVKAPLMVPKDGKYEQVGRSHLLIPAPGGQHTGPG